MSRYVYLYICIGVYLLCVYVHMCIGVCMCVKIVYIEQRISRVFYLFSPYCLLSVYILLFIVYFVLFSDRFFVELYILFNDIYLNIFISFISSQSILYLSMFPNC